MIRLTWLVRECVAISSPFYLNEQSILKMALFIRSVLCYCCFFAFDKIQLFNHNEKLAKFLNCNEPLFNTNIWFIWSQMFENIKCALSVCLIRYVHCTLLIILDAKISTSNQKPTQCKPNFDLIQLCKCRLCWILLNARYQSDERVCS